MELEKICNIAGYPMYPWASAQLRKRSEVLSNPNRSIEEINYLGNKGAWVRVVSSVDLEESFIKYFKDQYGTFSGFIDDFDILSPETLAKNFILFGGTSVYESRLRSGINLGGAYAILGDTEVKEYGYRPMPGIMAMTIESTGRMGSLRQATVNFRVSNKMQLDVMDALYFRPGFTLLIEYGHAKYIDNNGNLQSTESLMIDPFKTTDKENIGIEISRKIKQSAGNYGGMLSIITSFNFSMTSDGGYDCVLKTVSLGGVMGNYPINKLEALPAIYIKQLKAFLDKQRKEKEAAERAAAEAAAKEELSKLPNTPNDNWDDLKITDPLSNLIYNINPAYFQNATNSSTAERSMTAVNSGGRPYIKYDKNQIKSFTDEYAKNNKIPNQESTILAYPIHKSTTFPTTEVAIFIKQKGTYGYIQDKYMAPSTLPKQKGDIFVTIDPMAVLANSFKGAIGNPVPALRVTDALSSGAETTAVYTDFLSVMYSITSARPLEALFNLYYDLDYFRDNQEYYINVFVPAPSRFSNIEKAAAHKLVEDLFKSRNTRWKVTNTILYGNNNIQINLQVSTNFGEIILELGNGTRNADLSIITNIFEADPNQDLAKNKVAEQTDEIEQRIKTQIQDIKNRYQLETDAKTLQALASSQSAIELMLRSISLYAISAQKPDVVLDDKFIKDLFSEGAYSKIFKKISGGKLPVINYTQEDFNNYIDGSINAEKRLEINLRYGNSAYLMSAENTSDDVNLLDIIPQVELANLFKVKQLPYGEVADIFVDDAPKVSIYISLGLFLMMLNHCSLLYNKGKQDDTVVPMTYVDFNPSTNYYLSSINQFSINPFSFIMPYYGNDTTYKKLFKPGIINSNNQIELKVSGSTIQPHSVFKFSNDRLSKGLLNNKVGLSGGNSDGYIGRTMDTLVNVNFLLKIIRDYSTSSDYGDTYFQSILENITATLNKSTGYYNAFRLAYSDTANAYMIIDDQIQLKPDPIVQSLQYNIINNTSSPEIPIQGKGSIARSFELRTDISNRISSMLAISTNTGAGTQVGMGKNMGDFGVYNIGSYDRYIPVKTSSSSSIALQNNVQECQAAINFDTVVTTIYGLSSDQSKEVLSTQQVQNAMAYYKDRMARVKNEQPQSVSAMIIPIRTTITMDGFSGMYPFQLFTVNENVLPYRYSSTNLNNGKVAFTTTKITHNFSNNEWVTSMDGLMTFLKNPTDEQVTATITPGAIEVNITTGTNPPIITKSKTDFVKTYYPLAKIAGAGKIDPEIILAQSAEESSWGNANIPRNYNNFFGITAGRSWKGGIYTVQGKNGPIKFRVYDSPQDSFNDFVNLITTDPRYRASYAAVGNYKDYARAISFSPYIDESNGDRRPKYESNIISHYESILAIIKKENIN
jgi:flagellum-specific peptidoglycan hydrolase FlgJ